MNSIIKTISLFFLLIAGVILPFQGQAHEHTRTILVVHSYHHGYQWTDDITRAIDDEFGRSADVVLNFEYLDLRRFTHPEYKNILNSFFRHKYSAARFDLIITADNYAFEFIARQEIFAQVPVVFCGINGYTPEMIENPVIKNRVTGVTETYNIEKNIELILQLHPDLEELLVIGGKDPSSMIAYSYISDVLEDHAPWVKTKVLSDRPVEEVTQIVGSYREKAAVILFPFFKPVSGNLISFKAFIADVNRNSKIPLYSAWDFYLGQGIIGGLLTSGYEQGRAAATLARQILNGKKPSELPVITGGTNVYRFDAHQLERHNIDTDKLPNESRFINEKKSATSKFTGYLFTTIGIVVLLFFAAALLWYLLLKHRDYYKTLNLALERYKNMTGLLPDTDVMLFDYGLKVIAAEGQELTKLGIINRDIDNHYLSEIVQVEILELLQVPCLAALRGDALSITLIFARNWYKVQGIPVENTAGIKRGCILVITRISA